MRSCGSGSRIPSQARRCTPRRGSAAWEIRLRDLQVLEHNGARNLVDLRARVREDDAERFLLRTRRLYRKRRAEVDPVAVPFVDLRLVDQHLAVGEVDDARPRIGGQLRRSGSGRGGRLREHGTQGRECDKRKCENEQRESHVRSTNCGCNSRGVGRRAKERVGITAIFRIFASVRFERPTRIRSPCVVVHIAWLPRACSQAIR